MEKQLLEIKGYYSMNNKNEFTELNSWTGHIFLNDDLSFEGIVTNAGTTDDRLIIGTIVDYQGITLLKLNLFDEIPHGFYGFSDGNKIIGMFDKITPTTAIPCGKCKILLAQLQKDKTYKSTLEERIEAFKYDMGYDNEFLYDGFVEHMEETVLTFLHSSEEEKEEIECQENFKIKQLAIKDTIKQIKLSE